MALSLSVLVGPSAPSHLSGGQTSVGQGPIIETPVRDPNIESDVKKKQQKNRALGNKSQDFLAGSVPIVENSNGSSGIVSKDKIVEVLERKENWVSKNQEEKEWNEEAIEILKKQMMQNPVGMPKRWEVNAESFNGWCKLESVIKKAKDLGEKKNDDSDSYAQFLKNRKAVDVTVKENCDESKKEISQENLGGWSAGEDIALLNALKAFPWEVVLRWSVVGIGAFKLGVCIGFGSIRNNLFFRIKNRNRFF